MIPVIIPHYQKVEQLSRCVLCLEEQSLPVEIFIRDNNHDNVYFTAAINEGIGKYLHQDCRYMIALNQDMYLEPQAVQEMVSFMDRHPRCGIGAPLQLRGQDRDYCLCAGGLRAFPFGAHTHGPLSSFTRDEQIHWANGACMILRKEMIHEIGLLDKNFVFIGSDSDYSFTARARGWEVWRIVRARGVHEHGASGVSHNPEIELLKVNDMLYFGRKWLTGQTYHHLACQGSQSTPEAIAQVMEQLEHSRDHAIAAVEAGRQHVKHEIV